MSRYWFPGLLCAHVLIVWLLPVLPGQDLPQHLGYARILLEGRSDPLFREFYSLATGMQSYFTSYYLLTGLAHVVPLEAAARVLYTAYVIGMFFAFRALVVAVSGSPASTGLLVSLLVWSPVACMGFLAFLLATPALLAATALFLRIAEDPAGTRWRELALAVCCFVLGSLHVVANACLALFCALYTIFSPTRQRARALLLVLTAVALVSGLWVALGDRPLGTHAPLPTSDAIRSAMGLEFLNEAFQIAWQDPPAKLTYFLWNLLGPYRLGGQLVVAGVLGAVAFAVWKGGARPLPSAPRQRAFRRAVLAFLAAGWLTPWGLWIPSEVTFLDFRLISIGFALLAAAIDPRWFASRLAAGALASACVS